jgi:hypothetical protein
MQQSSSRNGHSPRRLLHRLDRVFAEMNVILLALAIGLAVLDVTCFSVLRLGNVLPVPQTTPGIERALLPPPSAVSAERAASFGHASK